MRIADIWEIRLRIQWPVTPSKYIPSFHGPGNPGVRIFRYIDSSRHWHRRAPICDVIWRSRMAESDVVGGFHHWHLGATLRRDLTHRECPNLAISGRRIPVCGTTALAPKPDVAHAPGRRPEMTRSGR